MNERETFTMSNHDSYDGYQPGDGQNPGHYGQPHQYDQTGDQGQYGQYGQPHQSQSNQYGAHTSYDNQTQANPTAGAQAYGQQVPADQSLSGAGFFKALFDFSFSTFITPKIVKFAYAISVGALGLLWVFMVIGGFADNAASGLLALIIGPVLILLYLVFIRMTLEFYVAIVRMSEDIHQRLR